MLKSLSLPPRSVISKCLRQKSQTSTTKPFPISKNYKFHKCIHAISKQGPKFWFWSKTSIFNLWSYNSGKKSMTQFIPITDSGTKLSPLTIHIFWHLKTKKTSIYLKANMSNLWQPSEAKCCFNTPGTVCKRKNWKPKWKNLGLKSGGTKKVEFSAEERV